MILQGVLRDSEEELLTQLLVVAGGGVEDDQHEAMSVLDGDNLSVEVKDGVGLMENHGMGNVHVDLRRRAS